MRVCFGTKHREHQQRPFAYVWKPPGGFGSSGCVSLDLFSLQLLSEAGLGLGFLPFKKSWFGVARTALKQELFHSREEGLSGSHLSGGLQVEGVYPPSGSCQGNAAHIPTENCHY